jgi:hypothetical protein
MGLLVQLEVNLSSFEVVTKYGAMERIAIRAKRIIEFFPAAMEEHFYRLIFEHRMGTML